MTDERKYRDEEVKEIFDLAASSNDVGQHAVSDERGLTMEHLARRVGALSGEPEGEEAET